MSGLEGKMIWKKENMSLHERRGSMEKVTTKIIDSAVAKMLC